MDSESDSLLLDAMLGKLARYLRMCGHDAAYVLDDGVEADDDVLAMARDEDRTLVTRDAQLAGRAADAVLVETKDVEGQLRELRAAGLDLSLTEPARCSTCNGRLEETEGPTPEGVPDPDERRVWRCRSCGQHFWKGSHWDDVAETLAEL
ncbi:Mut7-C RNAse domain-containing protein [Halomicrococcus gelatinilyticus]|uniref:Mut7-C RNAse domain-containing protein n=1 Tax=Halomicrococcus gelatinilyticus TaxID=1702103 RepID=UPI002E0F65CE